MGVRYAVFSPRCACLALLSALRPGATYRMTALAWEETRSELGSDTQVSLDQYPYQLDTDITESIAYEERGLIIMTRLK